MIVGEADDPEGSAPSEGEDSNDLSRHAVYSTRCNSGAWMPQSAGSQDGQDISSLKVQDPGQVEGPAQDGELWNYAKEDQLIIKVINITSAVRKAALVAFQEHSVDGNEAADFKHQAYDDGWAAILGPLGPALGRKTAGV